MRTQMNVKATARTLRPSLALALMVTALLGGACSSKAKFKLAEEERNPGYAAGAVGNVLVTALYPDADLEVRVVVESAFTSRLVELGVQAVPGYKHLDSYENLEGRVEEVTAKLEELGIDGIVLIDPIRARDYDPSSHEAQRAVYRAAGMSFSLIIATLDQARSEADASKYVMSVVLWNRWVKDYAWFGRYDIKAPNGWDLKYAKQHSADFASVVVGELRDEGLLAR